MCSYITSCTPIVRCCGTPPLPQLFLSPASLWGVAWRGPEREGEGRLEGIGKGGGREYTYDRLGRLRRQGEAYPAGVRQIRAGWTGSSWSGTGTGTCRDREQSSEAGTEL